MLYFLLPPPPPPPYRTPTSVHSAVMEADSEEWRQVIASLRQTGGLGNALPLCCPRVCSFSRLPLLPSPHPCLSVLSRLEGVLEPKRTASGRRAPGKKAPGDRARDN